LTNERMDFRGFLTPIGRCQSKYPLPTIEYEGVNTTAVK